VPDTVLALRDHALVGPDRQRAALEALARGGLELAPRDFTLRTDSTLAQLAAVRAGVGIGIAQAPLARVPVPLVRVLPKLAFWLEAWVVTHEDMRGVARVRAVVDHLVAELGAYGAPPETPRRAAGPTARPAASLRGGTRARRVQGR
jgi:DNA-binding transcriptional LysR family regulator